MSSRITIAPHHHSNPSTPQPRIRDEKIMFDVNIPVPIRLKQAHLPSQPSKNRRERHVDFRQRQVHPDALPRSPAKVEQPFLPRLPFRSEEACRVELPRLGEHGGIVVHVQGVHANGGAGRDRPVPERQGGVRVDALEPVDGAVRDAQAFVDDGTQVRQLFEILQRARRGGVRDGFFEFLGERAEDGRIREDVVGGYGQHVRGCKGSCADEALRFPDEAR